MDDSFGEDGRHTMTLRSMTGFGQSQGVSEGLGWRIEIRSVNARGLDVRLRLPPGTEGLEASARELVRKRLSRGAVNVTLVLDRSSDYANVVLNSDVLEATLAAIEDIATRLGQRDFSRASLDPASLAGMRGVIDSGGEQSVGAKDGIATFLVGLDAALTALNEHRSEEGRHIGLALDDQVSTIAELTREVEALPVRAPEAIASRLRDTVERLRLSQGLDDDRIHQEAVLLATRADIQEEIDRLKAHVTAARELIASNKPVGRRLDFLAQEFHREANTLCSKANHGDITRIGMEIKVIVDQFREQVQNIE